MTASLPPSFGPTRAALHRVATHVLARRRHQRTGRFGLRVAPGGFATPASGDDHEVLRVSGRWLVREQTGEVARTAVVDLAEASLADAAGFADVELSSPFEAGHDTPPVGDVDEPLGVDEAAARVLADWFAIGAAVLDAAVATAPEPASARPSVAQLWPEHFDVGLDTAVVPAVSAGAGERRVNLGASPGDEHQPEPYLYVGPWGDERPGDPSYWNAAFGAVLPWSAVAGAEDPVAFGVAFVQQGIDLLSGAR